MSINRSSSFSLKSLVTTISTEFPGPTDVRSLSPIISIIFPLSVAVETISLAASPILHHAEARGANPRVFKFMSLSMLEIFFHCSVVRTSLKMASSST